MKAKKILSMLLVGVTALGLLTGCSSNTDDTQNAGTDNAAAEEDQDSTADSSNNADAAQTAGPVRYRGQRGCGFRIRKCTCSLLFRNRKHRGSGKLYCGCHGRRSPSKWNRRNLIQTMI